MLKLPPLDALLPWYEANKRDLPWRHTKDPYRIWVSEIMLQQTRVEAVLPYYRRFLDTLPTVADLAAAPETLLLKLWEGLGYYSRVRNMQKAARSIMENENGVFPTTYEGIRALCGVGDYTAGAVASFAFDLPYPAVDGNVLRVAARLLAHEGNVLSPATKKELTAAVAAAQKALPPATFNQAIMELGATVCLPNGAPRCDACPLADRCLAKKRNKTDAIPVRLKPTKRKIQPKTVLVLRQNDTVLLHRRAPNGLLAGLFEPICLEGHQEMEEIQQLLLSWGFSPRSITPLGEAKHIFTHLEWHMTGYEILLDGDETPPPNDCVFARRTDLDTLFAIPSAFRAYRPFM